MYFAALYLPAQAMMTSMVRWLYGEFITASEAAHCLLDIKVSFLSKILAHIFSIKLKGTLKNVFSSYIPEKHDFTVKISPKLITWLGY